MVSELVPPPFISRRGPGQDEDDNVAAAVPDTNMADVDEDLSTRAAFDDTDDKPDLLELIVDDEIKQFLWMQSKKMIMYEEPRIRVL